MILAIVLMTDGANTQDLEHAYERYLTAAQLYDRTRAAALKIKEGGVMICAIQFGYRIGPQEALVKQVPSGPHAPYGQDAPEAAALKAAFQKVGRHLSQLRLSK